MPGPEPLEFAVLVAYVVARNAGRTPFADHIVRVEAERRRYPAKEDRVA